jgi:L-alanine-DL-glutamate epimerase-like enolase superfamily enzyme
MRSDSTAAVRAVEVAAYRIPTEAPESDGTLAWHATTLVLVRITAAGRQGLGYTYADRASATLVDDVLADVISGHDALQIAARHGEMVRAVRNLGREGIAAMAISAVDNALWDLKGRVLELPVTQLLGGAARDAIPVYGSGGFTSYDVGRLTEQLGAWASEGFARVKMKVARDPMHDVERVQAARDAIGHGVELFVDANGGYTRKQALLMAERFAASHVSWFEEPVPSSDVAGLRLLRDRAPPGMDISAGEYGFEPTHFRRLLESGAVDVLQADATRCGGLTGFMRAAALCDAFGLPLSSHCAPALHVAACCCAPSALHLEWFHDHQRIERMLFDGAPQPVDGSLRADPSRPGFGLDFKERDAREYLL